MGIGRMTRPAVTPSLHHPGTPDDDLSEPRRVGRIAARNGEAIDDNPYVQSGRVDWFLGHLDERLRRFFV